MAKQHRKKPYIIQSPILDDDSPVPGEWRDMEWGPFDDTTKALSFLRKENKEGEFRVVCVTARVKLTKKQIPKTTVEVMPLVTMPTARPSADAEVPGTRDSI